MKTKSKVMKGATRTIAPPTPTTQWHPGLIRFGRQMWYGAVPLHRLRVMAGNPPSRHDPRSKRQRNQLLIQSLKISGGPVQSITACGRPEDEYYIVADGNSRLAFSRAVLGNDLEVLVGLVDHSHAEVWKELNGRGRARIPASWERPWVFLHHPEQLQEWDITRFTNMTQVIGRERFEKFSKYGLGYSAWKQTLAVGRFCDMNEPEQLWTILMWICQNRLTGFVEQAIVRRKISVSSSDVTKAIIANRPLLPKPNPSRVTIEVHQG